MSKKEEEDFDYDKACSDILKKMFNENNVEDDESDNYAINASSSLEDLFQSDDFTEEFNESDGENEIDFNGILQGFLGEISKTDIDADLLQQAREVMQHREASRPNEFILELDYDIEDRFGNLCSRGLTVTVMTEANYIDWRDPEFQEYVLEYFKEHYGLNLYYEQVDRVLFNITRIH